MPEESRLNFQKNYFENPLRCLNFSILQLGEIYSSQKTSIEEHIQVCDEISFVVSGRAIMYRNGTPYIVEKGDCFLSFKDEEHRIESATDKPPHFCFVGFNYEDKTVMSIIKRLKEGNRKLYLPEAERIFNDMIRESWEENLYVGSSVGCYLYRLLILLARCSGSSDRVMPDASNIYRIMTYLQNHYAEPDAISSLGGIFFMSNEKLAEIFRSTMGESLRGYFTRVRMDKATELLHMGQTVTETAATLGYSTIHSFSRAYKNHFGIAPKSKKAKNRI